MNADGVRNRSPFGYVRGGLAVGLLLQRVQDRAGLVPGRR